MKNVFWVDTQLWHSTQHIRSVSCSGLFFASFANLQIPCSLYSIYIYLIVNLSVQNLNCIIKTLIFHAHFESWVWKTQILLHLPCAYVCVQVVHANIEIIILKVALMHCNLAVFILFHAELVGNFRTMQHRELCYESK